jgi:hypothetical protein
VYTEHGEPYADDNDEQQQQQEQESAVTSPQAVLRRPLIDAASSRSDDSYDNSPTQAGTGGARSSTNSLSKFNYNTPPPGDGSGNEAGMFSSASGRSRRGSLLAKTPNGSTATGGSSIGTVPLSTFNTNDSKVDATGSSAAAATADTSTATTATDSNSGSRIRQSGGSSNAASPAYV